MASSMSFLQDNFGKNKLIFAPDLFGVRFVEEIASYPCAVAVNSRLETTPSRIYFEKNHNGESIIIAMFNLIINLS